MIPGDSDELVSYNIPVNMSISNFNDGNSLEY